MEGLDALRRELVVLELDREEVFGEVGEEVLGGLVGELRGVELAGGEV